MSKYGEGMMYWTEVRSRGVLKYLGLIQVPSIQYQVSIKYVSQCLVVCRFAGVVCFLPLFEYLFEFPVCFKLRRTKRHTTREVAEWEEDMDAGGASTEQPELQWGFMEHEPSAEMPGEMHGQNISNIRSHRISRSV